VSRAIVVHELGGPEVLRYETVQVGSPGPGQALVRHTAIGVNFIDTYHRTGLYPLPALPHVLGVEAAGVVEAVGEGVEVVSPGQRVGYAARPVGSYAQRRLIGADVLVPLPDDVDDECAAAVLLKGLTVEYLIRRTFAVQAGMTVLLHAAAGGVGLIACQWLAHLGATVIGTVGSDAKADLVRAHGCAHPVVYTREDFVERVVELTSGAGVPVVYDSVGAATFEGSLACLAPRGMLVSFGNASGKPPAFEPLRLAQRGSLFLTRPRLFDYTSTRQELLTAAAALFEVIEGGGLKIEIGRSAPLSDAAEVHRALEARKTTGSLVLLP